ncbi:hypothetical protein BJV78DRAFT_1194423 [Lactifluus subvellereus]|nr:hypothetical protein BJV78DRAFT_1194423 [Lactifluus subvellereus]
MSSRGCGWPSHLDWRQAVEAVQDLCFAPYLLSRRLPKYVCCPSFSLRTKSDTKFGMLRCQCGKGGGRRGGVGSRNPRPSGWQIQAALQVLCNPCRPRFSSPNPTIPALHTPGTGLRDLSRNPNTFCPRNWIGTSERGTQSTGGNISGANVDVGIRHAASLISRRIQLAVLVKSHI